MTYVEKLQRTVESHCKPIRGDRISPRNTKGRLDCTIKHQSWQENKGTKKKIEIHRIEH
jgi:hypothetical protein